MHCQLCQLEQPGPPNCLFFNDLTQQRREATTEVGNIQGDIEEDQKLIKDGAIEGSADGEKRDRIQGG